MKSCNLAEGAVEFTDVAAYIHFWDKEEQEKVRLHEIKGSVFYGRPLI